MLLYIHGFNSSPDSDKARVTKAYMQQRFPELRIEAPQLPSAPQPAMALLQNITEQALAAGEKLCVIGSSLGGYFASWLVQQYGGRAVLVNPAVKPYELFEDYLGPQFNPYTGEHYQLLPEHQQQLRQYDTQVILNPERFLVLLQTADEVLDYRQALAKYHCCEMLLEAGGNHSFMGYGDKLDVVSRFLCLP
ncbi:YqiA/YcfP family alpha/beta fold hydrolase [Shewanella dokdonensis]|uniref:Esterase YqiA n=1 Tax=Shewanella dokdonensis TaxID=712036 RepID=A0ABX8DEJ5_9GAMM|nr:YqiA/YcfP family alpha/beta fold hydrolase [Shewanella dokdonensis]MCL1074803.1 esterase YqiA [Shewanella dokdonensis]QVK22222.1 esterase YqiA [Shewanella dokdonensis]